MKVIFVVRDSSFAVGFVRSIFGCLFLVFIFRFFKSIFRKFLLKNFWFFRNSKFFMRSSVRFLFLGDRVVWVEEFGRGIFGVEGCCAFRFLGVRRLGFISFYDLSYVAVFRFFVLGLVF